MKREVEFDIAKGIAIISVILGHLGIVYIDRVVYVYHMPLFFLISGYFLSTKVNIKDFIKKKADCLIIPYIVSCIFVILAYILVYTIWGYQARRDLLGWLIVSLYGAGTNMVPPLDKIGYIGATWFLLALFWALCVVRYCIDKKSSFLIICIISYIGYSTSKSIWIPFSVQAGLFATFYVYLGYIARQKNLLNISLNAIEILFMLSIVIWEVAFYNGLFMSYCFLGNSLMDVLASLCACFLVMRVCILISKHQVLSIMLSWYGRNSLIVLIFHVIEQNIVPYQLIHTYFFPDVRGWLFWIIVILIKFIWVTIGIVIVHKLSLLNKVFNGNISVFKRI